MKVKMVRDSESLSKLEDIKDNRMFIRKKDYDNLHADQHFPPIYVKLSNDLDEYKCSKCLLIEARPFFSNSVVNICNDERVIGVTISEVKVLVMQDRQELQFPEDPSL